ncbi:MAG TPA: hypothetical protein VHF27_08990 [Acidimicrobiales bacterium]|nr:hypothetical protein [Acidimicrobiales bacterium]
MGTRWTPFTALIALAAAVLGVAGIVAAAAHDDDGPPAREALVGGEVTTTVTAVPDTTTSTTAAPPETTTTSPPTTTGRTTTTTTTRRTTTTTSARPTTTTRPATPAPPGARPLCAAEQIELTGGPERLDYRAGQPVTLRTAIRNRSSSPCFYRGYTVTMTFLDPGGAAIIASSVVADDLEDRQFAPGERLSHSATWDPGRCPSPPCATPAPGIYSTQAAWSFSGGRYTVTRDFVLR